MAAICECGDEFRDHESEGGACNRENCDCEVYTPDEDEEDDGDLFDD